MGVSRVTSGMSRSESATDGPRREATRRRERSPIDVSLGARLVLLELLDEEQPLSRRELRTRTLLPGESVRQAVSELVATDLVTEYPPENDRDCRQYGVAMERRR